MDDNEEETFIRILAKRKLEDPTDEIVTKLEDLGAKSIKVLSESFISLEICASKTKGLSDLVEFEQKQIKRVKGDNC